MSLFSLHFFIERKQTKNAGFNPEISGGSKASNGISWGKQVEIFFQDNGEYSGFTP